MINYRKLVAISFFSFALSAGYAQTITIPSADSFRNHVAQVQKCYMAQETMCNGQSISQLYLTDNPKNYWQAVTKNTSVHSSSLPELPSNISYNTPQQPQTNTPAAPTRNTPASSNNSVFISDNTNEATGFVVG